MAAEHLTEQLQSVGIENTQVNRWWLHQANINMNMLIGKRLLRREATVQEALIVLDQYISGIIGSL